MKRIEDVLKKLWENREIAEGEADSAQIALDDLYYFSHDFSSREVYKEYEASLYADNEKATGIVAMIDRRILNIVKRHSDIEKRLSKLEKELLDMCKYYDEVAAATTSIKVGNVEVCYLAYNNYGEFYFRLESIRWFD